MYKTPLVHKILAVAAGCTFSLAMCVSVGAVPGPGGDAPLPAAPAPALAARATDASQASLAAQAIALSTATTLAGPSPTVASTTAPKVATPPSTRPPLPTTTAPAAAVAAPAAPAVAVPAPAPAPPVTAARRTPPSAEVQAAISGLVQRVGGLLRLVRPTPAQIAQAGDQICTGFDTGQTFAQVKATGLSMVPSSVSVSAATADWAVRTAVAMYCPDHAAKLV